MKPTICPFSEVCREGEEGFRRCSECEHSEYHSYYTPKMKKKVK